MRGGTGKTLQILQRSLTDLAGRNVVGTLSRSGVDARFQVGGRQFFVTASAAKEVADAIKVALCTVRYAANALQFVR